MNEKQKTAMQQALEALEGWDNYEKWVWPESALEQAKRNTTESLATLRAALAEPERHFCERCGKRLSLDGIHTCTPPNKPEPERPIWQTLAKIGASAPAGTWDAAVAPPARQPLTDEEILNIGKEARFDFGPRALPIIFARAIERAHGIT